MGSPTPEEIVDRIVAEWVYFHSPDERQALWDIARREVAALLAQVSSLRAELEEARWELDSAHAAKEAAGFQSTLAECISWLSTDAEKAEADANRKREALERIDQWAKAYPLKVFPEPDFAKVHEALLAAGLSLDQVSASNMRHVVEGVGQIARAALSPTTPTDDGG